MVLWICVVLVVSVFPGISLVTGIACSGGWIITGVGFTGRVDEAVSSS